MLLKVSGYTQLKKVIILTVYLKKFVFAHIIKAFVLFKKSMTSFAERGNLRRNANTPPTVCMCIFMLASVDVGVNCI